MGTQALEKESARWRNQTKAKYVSIKGSCAKTNFIVAGPKEVEEVPQQEEITVGPLATKSLLSQRVEQMKHGVDIGTCSLFPVPSQIKLTIRLQYLKKPILKRSWKKKKKF